ncbi:hypothetical protein [Halobacteriovorax marinus]|uniref:hypothetical protein n=1 Tax=Halobacteriovorax marinus TaxID=97084 RepID=UPI003A94397D
MDELASNIERLVFENKISKASFEIKKYLSQAPEINQNIFEIICKVFELTNESDINIKIQLIESSSNLNIKSYILNVLGESSDEEFYFLYPSIKKYFIRNGLLYEFEKVFEKYKNLCLLSKSYTKLEKEIEELIDAGLELELSKKEMAMIHFGQGDVDYFEREYANALEIEGESSLQEINISFDDPVWRKQSFIMKEIVLRTHGDRALERKKEFLKSIYELLLVNSETPQTLEFLLEYSVEMGHKDLADEVKALLVKDFHYLEEELDRKVSKLVEVKREAIEEIDLADDLFGDEPESKDITIRRLVNQINLLKDEKDLEGATELLRKLKEIDKEHTLVKELEEKEHKVKGSKLSLPKRTIAEIEQELLNELSIYVDKVETTTDEDSYLRIYTKKNVELMKIEELESQFRELVYSYNSLGFYENSILVLDRIYDETNLEIKAELEVLFLKAEVMRMAQNYYGALNIIERCLDEKPMTDNEKLSFYYLKGELLREVGRKKDALVAYSKVYSINKKYRMVAYRLKEIE